MDLSFETVTMLSDSSAADAVLKYFPAVARRVARVVTATHIASKRKGGTGDTSGALGKVSAAVRRVLEECTVCIGELRVSLQTLDFAPTMPSTPLPASEGTTPETLDRHAHLQQDQRLAESPQQSAERSSADVLLADSSAPPAAWERQGHWMRRKRKRASLAKDS